MVQAAVVALSGSVALLGDTVHNAADASPPSPLGIAFLLDAERRTAATPTATGRAEDLAGVVIVLTIAGSAALAAHQAVDRLLDPRDISHLPAVAAGPWSVSPGTSGGPLPHPYRPPHRLRRLVADGLHARTDDSPPSPSSSALPAPPSDGTGPTRSSAC
ncbi:cation transporter [Streptomyces clavuligerus]|uniref:cation transporter n=1 Tax=Streptomyces clavuligerus TaxID=1901 RepID=UPI0018CA7108|nr:cation transporter [Streptomyces clavuligerus]QPM15586.1 cation transporter [Streptomyces clavuligerus]